MRRRGGLAALVAIMSFFPLVDGRAAEPGLVGGPQGQLCAPGDLQETGLQGDVPKVDQDSGRAEQGYNCALSLVGQAVLDADGRNPTGNGNMAVASYCAYVSGPGSTFGPAQYSEADDAGGVAVIDVRDVANPAHVKTLKGSGSTSLVSETLHAVDAPGRSILVTGQYGNAGSELPGGIQPNPIAPEGKPMDVWDVTGDKCTDPVRLGTFWWPENIHNLTISGNGRYVFATQPTQVLDIAPMFEGRDPVYLGNLDNSMEYPAVSPAPGAELDDKAPIPKRPGDQVPGKYVGHQVASSFDGSRIYLGSQTPLFDVFTIADIGDWLADPATAKPKVVSQEAGRGHSVTFGSIEGKGDWVVHAEEAVFGTAYGCLPERLNPFAGAAELYFTNVTDVTDPKMQVAKFGLEINRPENCGTQLESGTNSSVHYQEFDRTQNARIVIVSMWNAGIRVVDVRDPANPRELGYFNPGDVDPSAEVVLDQAWGHPYFDAKTNTIWFGTASGGFWVVGLQEQLVNELGMSGPSASAAGSPATTGVPSAPPASPAGSVGPDIAAGGSRLPATGGRGPGPWPVLAAIIGLAAAATTSRARS